MILFFMFSLKKHVGATLEELMFTITLNYQFPKSVGITKLITSFQIRLFHL